MPEVEISRDKLVELIVLTEQRSEEYEGTLQKLRNDWEKQQADVAAAYEKSVVEYDALQELKKKSLKEIKQQLRKTPFWQREDRKRLKQKLGRLSLTMYMPPWPPQSTSMPFNYYNNPMDTRLHSLKNILNGMDKLNLTVVSLDTKYLEDL